MDDLMTMRELFYAALAFLGGMLVGSNNPTWLSSKWREAKEKAEKSDKMDELEELAKKVSELMKKGN